MTSVQTPVAARVFDGSDWHRNAALGVEGGRITGVIPGDTPEVDMIVPGFVDLQVNGGGGVQFNDDTTAGGLSAICAAHRRLGTTSLLATLITDTAEITDRAIAAVAQARAEGMILVTADPAVAACGGRVELIDGAGPGGSYRPRPSTG